MSLGRSVATFIFEVAGVTGAVGVLVALTIGRRPVTAELRSTTVVAVVALLAALAVAQLASAGLTLNQARRSALSERAAHEQCLGKTAGRLRLPFVRWVKARMGPDAVYAVDYTPPPDFLCLYFALLPALPAAPGQPAGWTIALGAVPAEMLARLRAHDASVQVFAPGFALERDTR